MEEFQLIHEEVTEQDNHDCATSDDWILALPIKGCQSRKRDIQALRPPLGKHTALKKSYKKKPKKQTKVPRT